MSKIDRRIRKTQEAIKQSLIELMSKKNFEEITIQNIADEADVSRGTVYLHYLDKYDLLDKLIEGHLNEMRNICASTAQAEYDEANLPWFEYLEEHFLFFSTMLKNKETYKSFHEKFLRFLEEEFTDEIDVTSGKNRGLNAEILLQFIVTSYVGIVEWWIMNEMPYSSEVMSKQIGELLERNL